MANGEFSAEERYSRQIRFPGIGEDGQHRLAAARVLVVGCGALGTVIADTLTRAGVGMLRIVDRDFVEPSNLQRQILFDEDDARQGLPKAIAAARKLSRINSSVHAEPVVADVTYRNVLQLVSDIDLIMDGTDNFEVRFLINDAALETDTPWVYGGCVAAHGQVMPVVPGRTACLRCLMEHPPEPGSTDTCDTAGVIAPAVHVVAALQCVCAMKLLVGGPSAVAPELLVVDVWEGMLRKIRVEQLRQKTQCPACVGGRRDWLSGQVAASTTVLCGRNAVQVTPSRSAGVPLDELRRRLEPLGDVRGNPFLVRFRPSGSDLELTVFPDGRAIVQGTSDPEAARTAYARYVGH
ncbi:MAG: thiazole biosynthesis adenylyltransferase ThiF [Planctomycetota bacterium]|nr:MAG: thiazole biosynthesis adenylyltransferase ThiF [Planctomycetota bacterium]